VFLRTTAADVEGFSAVQLFARIVRQRRTAFEVVDETAAAVSEICRRLDGIPLAIELAASQIDVLGVDEVRRGLDERFALLSVDRRAGIPRQRSMATGATDCCRPRSERC
jgi:predicted ATPase